MKTGKRASTGSTPPQAQQQQQQQQGQQKQASAAAPPPPTPPGEGVAAPASPPGSPRTPTGGASSATAAAPPTPRRSPGDAAPSPRGSPRGSLRGSPRPGGAAAGQPESPKGIANPPHPNPAPAPAVADDGDPFKREALRRGVYVITEEEVDMLQSKVLSNARSAAESDVTEDADTEPAGGEAAEDGTASEGQAADSISQTMSEIRESLLRIVRVVWGEDVGTGAPPPEGAAGSPHGSPRGTASPRAFAADMGDAPPSHTEGDETPPLDPIDRMVSSTAREIEATPLGSITLRYEQTGSLRAMVPYLLRRMQALSNALTTQASKDALWSTLLTNKDKQLLFVLKREDAHVRLLRQKIEALEENAQEMRHDQRDIPLFLEGGRSGGGGGQPVSQERLFDIQKEQRAILDEFNSNTKKGDSSEVEKRLMMSKIEQSKQQIQIQNLHKRLSQFTGSTMGEQIVNPGSTHEKQVTTLLQAVHYMQREVRRHGSLMRSKLKDIRSAVLQRKKDALHLLRQQQKEFESIVERFEGPSGLASGALKGLMTQRRSSSAYLEGLEGMGALVPPDIAIEAVRLDTSLAPLLKMTHVKPRERPCTTIPMDEKSIVSFVRCLSQDIGEVTAVLRQRIRDAFVEQGEAVLNAWAIEHPEQVEDPMLNVNELKTLVLSQLCTVPKQRAEVERTFDMYEYRALHHLARPNPNVPPTPAGASDNLALITTGGHEMSIYEKILSRHGRALTDASAQTDADAVLTTNRDEFELRVTSGRVKHTGVQHVAETDTMWTQWMEEPEEDFRLFYKTSYVQAGTGNLRRAARYTPESTQVTPEMLDGEKKRRNPLWNAIGQVGERVTFTPKMRLFIEYNRRQRRADTDLDAVVGKVITKLDLMPEAITGPEGEDFNLSPRTRQTEKLRKKWEQTSRRVSQSGRLDSPRGSVVGEMDVSPTRRRSRLASQASQQDAMAASAAAAPLPKREPTPAEAPDAAPPPVMRRAPSAHQVLKKPLKAPQQGLAARSSNANTAAKAPRNRTPSSASATTVAATAATASPRHPAARPLRKGSVRPQHSPSVSPRGSTQSAEAAALALPPPPPPVPPSAEEGFARWSHDQQQEGDDDDDVADLLPGAEEFAVDTDDRCIERLERGGYREEFKVAARGSYSLVPGGRQSRASVHSASRGRVPGRPLSQADTQQNGPSWQGHVLPKAERAALLIRLMADLEAQHAAEKRREAAVISEQINKPSNRIRVKQRSSRNRTPGSARSGAPAVQQAQPAGQPHPDPDRPQGEPPGGAEEVEVEEEEEETDEARRARMLQDFLQGGEGEEDEEGDFGLGLRFGAASEAGAEEEEGEGGAPAGGASRCGSSPRGSLRSPRSRASSPGGAASGRPSLQGLWACGEDPEGGVAEEEGGGACVSLHLSPRGVCSRVSSFASRRGSGVSLSRQRSGMLTPSSVRQRRRSTASIASLAGGGSREVTPECGGSRSRSYSNSNSHFMVDGVQLQASSPAASPVRDGRPGSIIAVESSSVVEGGEEGSPIPSPIPSPVYLKNEGRGGGGGGVKGSGVAPARRERRYDRKWNRAIDKQNRLIADRAERQWVGEEEEVLSSSGVSEESGGGGAQKGEGSAHDLPNSLLLSLKKADAELFLKQKMAEVEAVQKAGKKAAYRMTQKEAQRAEGVRRQQQQQQVPPLSPSLVVKYDKNFLPRLSLLEGAQNNGASKQSRRVGSLGSFKVTNSKLVSSKEASALLAGGQAAGREREGYEGVRQENVIPRGKAQQQAKQQQAAAAGPKRQPISRLPPKEVRRGQVAERRRSAADGEEGGEGGAAGRGIGLVLPPLEFVDADAPHFAGSLPAKPLRRLAAKSQADKDTGGERASSPSRFEGDESLMPTNRRLATLLRSQAK